MLFYSESHGVCTKYPLLLGDQGVGEDEREEAVLILK